MSTTNESIAFEGFSAVIRSHVIGPICQYLASKGVNVSQEELVNVLKLAATPPSISSATPPMITSNMFSGMSSAPKSGGRSRNRGPVPDEERCRYRVTRGNNVGTQCTNRREDGNYFCTTCKTKKAAQKQLAGEGLSPNPSGGSGIPSLPSFGMRTELTAIPREATKEMSVTDVGNGFFKDTKYGLCIRRGTKADEHTCIGFHDQVTGDVKPLTPEMIQYCKEMGLNYVNSSNEPKPSSIQVGAIVPENVPAGFSSVGQSVPVMNQPSPAGLPSLNGFSSVGQPSPAGLPSVGQSLPMTTQSLPMTTQSLPMATQSLPMATQSLPMTTQSLPMTTQSLPTMMTQSLPMTTQSLPTMMTQTAPAGLPSVGQSLPMTQTAPAGLPSVGQSLPMTQTAATGLPLVNPPSPVGLPSVGQPLPTATQTPPVGLPSVGQPLPTAIQTTPVGLPSVNPPSSDIPAITDTSKADDPVDNDGDN